MITVLDGQSSTNVVLIKTMCLVEQVFTARPLTSAGDDPDDMEASTPIHFLLGRAYLSAPFLPDAQRNIGLGRVFRVSQTYSDIIWTNWTKEYLPDGKCVVNGKKMM